MPYYSSPFTHSKAGSAKALNFDYDPSNTIFNIACAYSLDGKSDNAFLFLVYNFLKGDRNLSRVKSDPDLLNFRKSAKYSEYLSVVSNIEGEVPSSGKELFEYINGRSFCTSDEPSPGVISFKKDGDYISGGMAPGSWDQGKWRIDYQKRCLIITNIGTVHYASRFPREGDTPDMKKHPVLNQETGEIIGYFVTYNPYDLCYPFDEMRLDIYKLVDNGFFDLLRESGITRRESFQKSHRIMGMILYPNRDF